MRRFEAPMIVSRPLVHGRRYCPVRGRRNRYNTFLLRRCQKTNRRTAFNLTLVVPVAFKNVSAFIDLLVVSAIQILGFLILVMFGNFSHSAQGEIPGHLCCHLTSGFLL